MLMVLNVVLIDDEKIALQELAYILEQYKEIQIMGTFIDPLEALIALPKLSPNVVFLDIEMPEVNGFAVAEQIMELSLETAVVFVTAFDEYAIKAFEVSAIDYILKPVSLKRIEKTIGRLLKGHMNDHSKKSYKKDSYQQVLNGIRRVDSPNCTRLFVYQEEEILLLKPADILYIMTEGGAVVIVTDRKIYKTRETLNYWEEKLGKQEFFRCHRCYLVNLGKVEKIVPGFNNTYLLRISNHSSEIPVSRNYSKMLKQLIMG